MQPGFVEIINGVKKLIFEVLLPELQTPQARGQAMYAGLLLDHLAARWDIELPLLLEEHGELRALLEAAIGQLPREEAALKQICQEALAAGTLPAVPYAPTMVVKANEAMRPLVADIAAVMPAGAVGASLRDYLKHQHERDQRLVAVGGLAW